jgi:hypothetical protein
MTGGPVQETGPPPLLTLLESAVVSMIRPVRLTMHHGVT